jgi:hypothetical protein
MIETLRDPCIIEAEIARQGRRRSPQVVRSYEGKSISYGSGEEMRAAIASLEAELGLSRPVVGVVRSDKGY